MPVAVNANRTIAVDEVLDLPNESGGAISIANASPAITLTNLGTINVSTTGGASAVASNATGSSPHAVFINGASGTVNATAIGQAGITGFSAFNGMGDFYNLGHFNVIATQGYAIGVNFNGSSSTVAPIVENSGSFLVDGLLQAVGVIFSDTGVFRNSGTFEVSGSSDYTIGVWIGGTTTFENSGSLRAVSNAPASPSIAVYISDGALMFNEIGSYRNSGLIEGDWAFKVIDASFYSFETIINTGTILGDFLLGRAIDLVTNAGTIVGDINLGEDDDLYNGIGGTLDGLVYAGDGADRLIGGSGAENLFGEGGNDALSGGLGDDFLEGGSGADAIDGGGGFDTLSYQAFAGSVTVDLTTGRVIGDGQDRISGIERVIGAFGNDSMLGTGAAETFEGRDGNDVLNGGGGIDTLIGGFGDDLLRGGDGADTFRFNAGLFGNDTVADFADGVDLIDFSGLAGVDDFSDLVVTANGGNALITLSDGSTITLTGVASGLVDASDFVFGP